MGGYSVMCVCGKWFESYSAYKNHCKSTGHRWYPHKVGTTLGTDCNCNTCKVVANKYIKEDKQ